MTDEQLRELFAKAGVACAPGARGACPSPEEMLALVRREGAEERRLEVLDHVMGCTACHGEFDLLRAVEWAGKATGAATPVRAPVRWRRFVPLAAAASLLVVAGIGLRERASRDRASDVPRSGGEEVVLLAPATSVAAGAPVTFAWRPVPGATRYELEVVDSAGAAVFSASTADTSAVLRDAGRLAPGAEYHWWVRAVRAGGTPWRSAMRPLRAD